MTRALAPAISSALSEASRRLTGAGVPHAVGGSVLLWALGIPLVPGDVDILTVVDAREAVSTALPWDLLPPPQPSEKVSSRWIDRYRAPGVVVEVMADMTVLGSSRPVAMGGERSMAIDGVDVPLGNPDAWLDVYRVLRPERAEALFAVLDGHT